MNEKCSLNCWLKMLHTNMTTKHHPFFRQQLCFMFDSNRQQNFKASNKEWVIKNKEPNYDPPMLHVLNNKELFLPLLVSLIMLPRHKCNLMTHRIQNFSLNWNIGNTFYSKFTFFFGKVLNCGLTTNLRSNSNGYCYWKSWQSRIQ